MSDWGRQALLAAAAVAVVVGGVWGVLTPREAGHPHPPASPAAAAPTVDVPGGVLRLDGLADKTVGQAMQGMNMPDDVPVGLRRFAVNVTLATTGDEPLRYTERDFTVQGPGVAPVVPVRSDFDSGAVPAGTALSGSITFEVPDDVTAVGLRFRDSAMLPVPPLPAVEPDGGHHPGTTTAPTAPAATEPGHDDGHDHDH